MALWQISFIVLPIDALRFKTKFEVPDIREFDSEFFWTNSVVTPDFFDSIAAVLPRTQSWADYIVLYGDEKSNRFEVEIYNGVIGSVSFRIDFTSEYEEVLRGLIVFFLTNDLIVLDSRLRIVPLNFESFNLWIQESPEVKIYKRLSEGNDDTSY